MIRSAEDLLTAEQVEQQYNICRATLGSLLSEGRLEVGEVIGGQKYWRREQIESFIAVMKEQGVTYPRTPRKYARQKPLPKPEPNPKPKLELESTDDEGNTYLLAASRRLLDNYEATRKTYYLDGAYALLGILRERAK